MITENAVTAEDAESRREIQNQNIEDFRLNRNTIRFMIAIPRTPLRPSAPSAVNFFSGFFP